MAELYSINRITSCLSKKEYLAILKEKTYEFTISNMYLSDCYLSIINGDKISVYYTGKGLSKGGFKWFEAIIEESQGYSSITGEFVVINWVKHVLIIFLSLFWFGILWFIIPEIYLGIYMIPLGIAITLMLIMFIKKTDSFDNRKEIIEFLTNLDKGFST